MIAKDGAELDLTFEYRIDDFGYVVYAATGKMKCFGCNTVGYLIWNCPEKRETPVATQNTIDSAGPPETAHPAVDKAVAEVIMAERAEPEAVVEEPQTV